MKTLKSKPSELRVITFRVDDECIAALGELEAAMLGYGIVVGATRRRSMAIRKALLEARDRLRENRG
jgi:hypothetical protein